MFASNNIQKKSLTDTMTRCDTYDQIFVVLSIQDLYNKLQYVLNKLLNILAL